MTTDQNGNRKPIPCEKEAIGVTLLDMLRKRRQYHLGFDQRDLYRWFTALQSSFMRGLPQRLTLKLLARAPDPMPSAHFGFGSVRKGA